MASSVERLLQRYQDNREPIAKWAAILAMAWSGVVLVMSLVIPEVMTASGSTFSPQLILTAVKLSMPPVLIAGVAWGTARSVRARKTGLLTMGAVWFCVLIVFVSQVQYYRLVAGAGIVKPATQTEQGQ
jgi:hypothetical protein